MKIYNKLVRDKIPSIIEKDNKELIIKRLRDDEYKIFDNKLQISTMFLEKVIYNHKK